jgi:hypothetical protein
MMMMMMTIIGMQFAGPAPQHHDPLPPQTDPQSVPSHDDHLIFVSFILIIVIIITITITIIILIIRTLFLPPSSSVFSFMKELSTLSKTMTAVLLILASRNR